MQPKWDAELRLTEPDILRGLKAAHLRHAGQTRLIVQSVLLAAVAAYGLIAYFCAEEPQTASLVIGILAVLLGVIMWVAPEFQLRQMAHEAAAGSVFVHLWVFDEGVGFGKDCPTQADDLCGYDSFCSATDEDLMVWQFDDEQAVIVKKDAVGEDCWAFLTQKVENNLPYPRRKRHHH